MDKKDIGAILKAERIKSRMQTAEVIQALKLKDINISEKTLYGYENGQSAPKIGTLFALCEIYNITDIGTTFGFSAPNAQKKSATKGDGLEERLSIFNSLSPEAQKEALDYMQFLKDKEASNQ